MPKPRSIQSPGFAYLPRHVYRFTDPTWLTSDQWRIVSREPINKMAQRFIVRELAALKWVITSDRRDDPRVDEYTKRWDEIFEMGDGFDVWESRMIEDACSLPFGGASEVGYRGEELDWVLHVDGATLYPTYEKLIPYVQVSPDDATQRVYYSKKQLKRLRVNPRTCIRYKEYNISPTEDGFLAIEALSKIYLYYMQELTDTVPPGILDVPGWTEPEAMDWARNFREMMEGIDPIKVPILYDHLEGPANFIPFQQSPQDLNILEQFKRFAEMLLGVYGLSIGDLRLFEHESTKAGERVSQMVTERSGVGYWADLIETYLTRLLPPGLTFGFKQPRPERELTVANRKAVQMNMLLAAAGMQPIVSTKDALEEARALELFTTEVLTPEEMSPPPTNGGAPPETEVPGGRPEEELDQEADEDLVKAYIEKQLGQWRNPIPPASERLAALVSGAFAGIGEAVDAGQVGEIAEEIERALEPVEGEIEKGGPGSGNWGHSGYPGRGGSSSGGGLAAIGAKPGHSAHERRALARGRRVEAGKEPGRIIVARRDRTVSQLWNAQDKVYRQAATRRRELHERLVKEGRVRNQGNPEMVREDLASINAKYNRKMGQAERWHKQAMRDNNEAMSDIQKIADFDGFDPDTQDVLWRPKPGIEQVQLDTAIQHYKGTEARMAERREARLAVQDERLTALRRAVQVGTPLETKEVRRDYVGVSDDERAAMDQKIDTAMSAWGQLVDNRHNTERQNIAYADPETGERIFRAGFSTRSDVSRASAGDGGLHISLGPHDGVSTVIHEMGHGLEHQSYTARANAFRFYEYRTKGENLRKLADATGNPHYEDYEVTKVDRFPWAYSGKFYGNPETGQIRATEILSMGIQEMYKNPHNFAVQDPEYFDMVYITARGGSWWPPEAGR